MRYRNHITTPLLFLIILFSYQNCAETNFTKRDQSSTATFSAGAPASLEKAPEDQTVMLGGDAAFYVGVSGDAFFEYQWYLNGRILPNEMIEMVNVASAQMEDAGEYSVDVFADGELFQRLSAHLTVLRCQAGEKIQCTDASTGRSGAATCFSDGSGYGACVPDDVPDDSGDSSAPAPKNCTTPWGATVAHGSSVRAYQAAQAVGSCASQSRVCNDGSLSGSFGHKACSVKQGYWKCVSGHVICSMLSTYKTQGCPKQRAKCSTNTPRNCSGCVRQSGGTVGGIGCKDWGTVRFKCQF